MPFRRRGRRRNHKRPKNIRAIARAEARKTVQKTVETKMYDSLHSGSIDYTTGVVYSVWQDPSTPGTIQQGTNDNEYIGQKVQAAHITIKYQLIVADATNLIRLIVLQTKGLFVPTMATVLQNNGTTSTPLSPYNQDNDSKFKVLASRLISLDTYNSVRAGTIVLRKFRPTYFANATGGVESNNIYICAISDSGAVSHPTIQYNIRTRYRDA